MHSVTPCQWMGVSIYIMSELMSRGELASDHINTYLTYMLKISELASKYTWQSLLRYDREYRRWQAQYKTTWASDNIHLVEVFLESRPRNTRNANKPPVTSTNKTTEVCRLYNAGKCSWGTACRYRHTCSVSGCNAKHPQIEHTATDQSKN